MLPAPRPPMHLRLLLILALCAGCSDSLVIEGTLFDDTDASEVRYRDDSSPTEVSGGRFEIEGVSGDTVKLVFVESEGAEAVMTLIGVPEGGRVSLHDVWFADGLAFPTRVASPGHDLLTVNGIRMGAADRIAGDQEIRGTVLAISARDGTFLLRPVEDDLPDIGIFVGTGTVIQTVSGAPFDLAQVRFGDTLTVRGVGASGYLLSNAILRGGGAEVSQDNVSQVLETPSAPRPDEAGGREEDDAGDQDERDDEDEAGPGRGRGRGRPGFTPGRRN